eukprot:216263-Rhodomonas_salina.2
MGHGLTETGLTRFNRAVTLNPDLGDAWSVLPPLAEKSNTRTAFSVQGVPRMRLLVFDFDPAKKLGYLYVPTTGHANTASTDVQSSLNAGTDPRQAWYHNSERSLAPGVLVQAGAAARDRGDAGGGAEAVRGGEPATRRAVAEAEQGAGGQVRRRQRQDARGRARRAGAALRSTRARRGEGRGEGSGEGRGAEHRGGVERAGEEEERGAGGGRGGGGERKRERVHRRRGRARAAGSDLKTEREGRLRCAGLSFHDTRQLSRFSPRSFSIPRLISAVGLITVGSSLDLCRFCACALSFFFGSIAAGGWRARGGAA